MSPRSRPAISVLLPARDAEATVGLALDSVLRSTEPDFELIVVEHASEDDTRASIERRVRPAGERGVALSVVEAPAEASFAEALELGRAACRAPLVARMDADDLMHPRRLAADKAFLDEQADIAAVACRVKIFPRASLGSRLWGYIAWQNEPLTPAEIAREIWVEQPLCHPATTFRAAALDEVGGYRHGPFPEDYDLFLRLHNAGYALAKRPDVHHGWREHRARATWNDPRMDRDAICRRKVAALVERYALGAREVFVAGAGKEGGRVGRALVEQGVSPALYFDVAPARIGRVRHGARVAPADDLAAEREAAGRRSAAAGQAGPFLIAAVGTSGSRPIVRGQIAAAGFAEPDDAVVVA